MKTRIAPILGSLVLALWGCSAGDGGTAVAPASGPPDAAKKELVASTGGELLGYFRSRLADAVKQAGQNQGYTDLLVAGSWLGMGGAPVPAPAPEPSAAGTSPSGSALNASSTTVQEAGVDEDDLVKTDGQTIYSLVSDGQSNRLQAYRVLPTPPLEKLNGLSLPPGAAPIGMLLAADAKRLALLSSPQFAQAQSAWFYPGFWFQSATRITLVDVRDPANLATTHQINLEGGLVGSRLIGNTLYLATRWFPRLPVFDFSGAMSSAQSNQLAIDSLTANDILPHFSIDAGAPQPLVAERDCFVQAGNGSPSLDVITVTAIDLGSSDLNRSSRCFVGGSEAFYMSADSLYLATTRYTYAPAAIWSYPQKITTDIHKFAINGLSITYRGTGEVTGNLGWNSESKSYRMGEYQGDLRVLTFTGSTGWGPVTSTSTTASPASLSILRESGDGKTLSVIATLPNARHPEPLGLPGQQIYATRFLGTRGYLVTYRAIDPLYVLDLTDPKDPKAAGSLQVPGYSDYLFPVGESMLLGVGRIDGAGAAQSVRIALFDLTDPSKPQELTSRSIAGSASALSYSRHGITFQTVANQLRVALPVQLDFVMSPWGCCAPSARALYRYAIDTRSGVMTDRTPLAGPDPSHTVPLVQYTLGSDRAVLIDAQVHYFSDGGVASADW